MRKRHVVVGGAVAAAVLSLYSTSFGAKSSKIPQAQLVTKDSMQSLNVGYTSGLMAGSGPEASATWIGPALNISGTPPTDPREGFYNVASNWSPATIPNGATDVATWNDNGDLFGYRTHIQSDITLAGMTFNNQAGVDVVSALTPGTTRTVTTGTGGLQLNGNVLTFERSLGQNRFITVGDALDFSVAGSGAIVKNGPADLWLVRPNTNAGGMTINGGRVIVFSGAPSPGRAASEYGNGASSGDELLGAAGATLTINNGGGMYIRQDAATGLSFVFNRPVQVNGNVDIDFDGEGSPEFAGGVFGTGNLRMGDGGDSAFSAATAYTGETIIDNYNFHTLRGDGANVNSSVVRNFGRYDLLNGLSFADVNRHGDSNAYVSYGAEMVLGGGGSHDATEDIGNFVLRTGQSVLTVRNPAFQLTTLSADALVRENRSTLVIRGQNFGEGTAGLARSKFLLTSAPTLVGGVVPYVVGFTGNDSAVEDETGVARSVPVTYDVDGLRPLRASEMTASIGAGGHAKISGANSSSGSVNSLTLAPGATNTGSVGIASGVVVDQGPGSTLAGNLAFGSSEAVFHTTADGSFSNSTVAASITPVTGLTVSAVISGTNGLTKAGKSDLVLTGANTFSGPVTITDGRIVINSDVTPGVAGPLGQSSDPINIQASANSGGFEWQGDESSLFTGVTAGTVTVGRNIVVGGQNQALTGSTIGNIDAASTLRITGNIDLGSTTTADVSGNNVHLTVANGTTIVDGVISGPGRLETTGSTVLRLNSANTHTGGTELGVGNWAVTPLVAGRVEIGNNAAFGTGRVDITTITELRAVGGPKTVANDFLLMGGVLLTGTDQMTFSGTWDLNVNQSRQVFNVGSLTTVNFNGPLVNGGFFKLGIGTIGQGTFGAGTMVLNAANNLSSVIQVGNGGNATTAITPGGVLVARHPQALGAGGQGGNFTRVLNGSTLILDAANGDINMPTEELVANGDGITPGFGAIRSISGNNILGNLNLVSLLSGSATPLPANMNIHVVAGSSLATDTLFDLSGTATAAVPPVPALRGPGSGTLTKSGAGVLSVNRIFNTEVVDSGVLPITGGTTNAGRTLLTKKAIGGLEVQGGTLRISAGAGANTADKVTAVKAVTIAGGAALDLTNNAMVVDYTGSSPRAALEALLSTGRAGGAWNGAGINSSSAAAGPVGRFSIGIAEQTDTGFATSYFGAPIDSTSLLFRYTVSGDANLDGTANINDFAFLAANFNQAGRWATGDFNYDGLVNIGDFSLLAANFNSVVPGDLPRGAAVPEPAALSLIGLGVAGLAARRRRA